MTLKYIALLRAINVSGTNIIKMEDLRQWMALPGFKNVATYIQTGNILFESTETDAEKLRIKIEKKLLKETGKQIDTMIRSQAELEAAVAANPFTNTNPAHKTTVYICFLAGEADKEKAKALEAMSYDLEQFKVIGNEMYYHARKDVTYKSIYTPALTEKKLGLKSTSRNMNTCEKLVELMKK